MLHTFQRMLSFLTQNGWKKIKIAFIISIMWFIWKHRAKKHKTIPMRNDFLPIIGHLLGALGIKRWYRQTIKNDQRHGMDLQVEQINSSKHRVACFAPFGRFPSITLYDPKLIKFVFQDNFENFVKSNMLRERTEEIFGDGIFASDPPQWKMHRKIGSRAFSMRNLKNYMFEVAMRGDIRFMNKIEQLRTTTHSIDIYDLFAIYTLDVFVEIAFGQSLQIIEAIPKPHPFSKAFDKSLQLIMWRFRNPFFRTFKYFQIGYEKELSKCLKEVDKFANDMLKSISDNMDKGSLRDTSGGQQLNMLSLFLKHNPNLTRKDLRDIAMNFIIAGRDTTRSLLAWFLYELSLKKNEEIEKKIMLEINNFYENEKELTYENIQNHYENNSEK
eukprot:143507_1